MLGFSFLYVLHKNMQASELAKKIWLVSNHKQYTDKHIFFIFLCLKEQYAI